MMKWQNLAACLPKQSMYPIQSLHNLLRLPLGPRHNSSSNAIIRGRIARKPAAATFLSCSSRPFEHPSEHLRIARQDIVKVPFKDSILIDGYGP